MARWKSPGPVGDRALYVWHGIRYLGGRSLTLAGEYPLGAFLLTVGLTSGRVWIRQLTWKLLTILVGETLKSTWAISSRSAVAVAQTVPGVATRTAALTRWARSPAGKGFGAGAAIGTLLIYPTLAKEGYITGYTGGFTQEQQMKEIISEPGLPPGLGTRPILYGGGGGGIVV